MVRMNAAFLTIFFYCSVILFSSSEPQVKSSDRLELGKLQSQSDKVESALVIEFDMEVLNEEPPKNVKPKVKTPYLEHKILTADYISKELVDWEKGGKFFNITSSIEVLEINHRFVEEEVIMIGSLDSNDAFASIPEPSSSLYLLFSLFIFCQRRRK